MAELFKDDPAFAADYLTQLQQNGNAVDIMLAQRQIQQFEGQFVYRPEGVHEGIFPGPRLRGVSDSRITMAPKAMQVADMLRRMRAGL